MARLDLFRQQAPEFNNIRDEAVEAWFSSALIFMDSLLPNIPASRLDLSVALYAAHLCWLAKYPGQGGAVRGPVLSEKDGTRERKHQLIQNSDTWLGQSSYGLAFSNLNRTNVHKSAILTRFGTN